MLFSFAMNDHAQPQGGAMRHERFRNFGSYKNFGEPDAELRAYCWPRTPQVDGGAGRIEDPAFWPGGN
jgi:hypothetical protein